MSTDILVSMLAIKLNQEMKNIVKKQLTKKQKHDIIISSKEKKERVTK